MRITVWNPSRKVDHLGKVISDRKIMLIERTSFMLDEIESKTVHEDEGD